MTTAASYKDFANALEARSRVAANVLHRKLPHFHAGSKILDFGFGDGALLVELARLRSGHGFWGVDPNPLELNALRASIACDKFQAYSRLDELDNDLKFDLIIASHVYYYYDFLDWPDLHSKLINRLAPGGLLSVAMASNKSRIYYSEIDATRSSSDANADPISSSRFLHIEDLMRIRPGFNMSWDIQYGLDVDEKTFQSFYIFANRLTYLKPAQADHCSWLYKNGEKLVTDKWLIYSH